VNPKRIALWFLIVSVAVSAVVGIIAIVVGTFGRTEAQILLTTLTISAASICALACGALFESGRARVLPAIGIVLAIIDATLFIIGIWSETESESYWKFSASVGLIAVPTAHVSLLALAKLAPRFLWSRIGATAAAYLLGFLFIYIIYITPKGDTPIRIIGVTSIVLAALTILTPVFHRLSRSDLIAASSALPAARELRSTISCPQCGVSLRNSLVETTCDRCGCKFLLTILNGASTGTRGSDS
jgi:hypothetical protein